MKDIPLTSGKARMVGFMGLVTGKDLSTIVKNRPLSLQEALARKWEKPGKYGNRKTEYNGRMFDSAHEARCAQDLDSMRKAKSKAERVVDIQYQVRYPIKIKGKKICDYIADFVVTYADGRTEVVDAKGVLTDVYKLKKKMMFAEHGIEIREI